jgi:multimeric flavodoxin WrbA
MEKDIVVVGVISSAREGSNSAVMVREALKGAAALGAKAEEIYLPGLKIEFCRGCLTCMQRGRCFMDDDFQAVRERLYNADGIIWGSPAYAGAPNAIMKNVIDRLGMYEVSTSSLGGKYMAGISAANSAGAAKKVAKGLSRFGSGGTFLRSYSSGFLGESFSGGRKAVEDEKTLLRARRLGEKLTQDIRTGRRYALQSIFSRAISSLIMRPAFRRYIISNRDGDAKVLYNSLSERGLI